MVCMLRLFLFAISIRLFMPDEFVALGAEMVPPPQSVARTFAFAELVYDQSSVMRNTLFIPIKPSGITIDARTVESISPAALTEERVHPANDCATSVGDVRLAEKSIFLSASADAIS